MPNTLVVVESPAKAKTIEKYLGEGFTVRASYGHLRDLPKSQLGVDLEHDFKVDYVIPDDSKGHVAELKRVMKKSDDLILATDYDREGEAIAYHVATVLGVDPAGAKRVTFTEITKDAILEAFQAPREIDLRLFEAQEARRILDRLVGYRISPILWKKVRSGLSAGRVQSVAVRLIVEREREIRAFNPVEYWSIDVRLSPSQADEPDLPDQPFLARLQVVPDGKLAANPDKKGLILGEESAATAHAVRLERATYAVTAVEKKERKRSPAPPFTTSTLQQEAARKLGFSARKTMTLAQRLYEGIDLPGEGTVGLITYMRTDSVSIAESALAEITAMVHQTYGAEYTVPEPRHYKNRSRNAQEAHEAVRPTSATRRPDALASVLDRDQLRLYRLIWQRTVATQMAEARFNQTGIDIEAVDGDARYGLRATGQVMIFDGFMKLYLEGRDDELDEDAEAILPDLADGDALRKLAVVPEQHFTQPPPRYSEASLVKTLEELGIGRPSTYASIIDTVQRRQYVRLENKRFYPEDVGEIVTDKLIDHFPDIVDVHFTAAMEKELDDIAEGLLERNQMLEEFNGPFVRALEKAEHSFERYEENLDETCPVCPTEGREPGALQVKLGRFGKFVGCTNYPECKFIRNMDGTVRPEPELLDELCPECGKQLMKRVGRFGEFTGCSGYPDCKFIKKEPAKSMGVVCPECKVGDIVERNGRFGTYYACDQEACEFTANNPPVGEKPCPQCKGVLLERPKSLKCWTCGAEFTPELEVKKDGDVESEAAMRDAKRKARAERAAAKAAKTAAAKKKKAPAKRKTTTKKKATAKKKKPAITPESVAAAAAMPEPAIPVAAIATEPAE